MRIGEQIKNYRKIVGLTQEQVANYLGVSTPAVNKWEKGDRYPDLLTTKKISQILDVSLDDLLAGKDMVKLVERNPVIEKKSANYIMIALYAFIWKHLLFLRLILIKRTKMIK